MLRMRVLNFSFAASWRMALLAVLTMVLFIRLGFWQLHRAAEKRALLAAYQEAVQQAPVTLPPTPYPFQAVQVKGHYLPITFLLDNQHHDHQFGYNVLSPLLVDHKMVVMVDRGWIAGDPARLNLPKIQTPEQALMLTGYAYYPSAKTWVLGVNLEPKRADLLVMERIDTTMISEFLHKSVYPFIIRQSTGVGGYVQDWPIVASSPVRHDAYALQWFMFALVVGILFIGLHVKKVR